MISPTTRRYCRCGRPAGRAMTPARFTVQGPVTAAWVDGDVSDELGDSEGARTGAGPRVARRGPRPAPSAVAAGYRTYYTTTADLVARCHRAAPEGRWTTCMRFFAGSQVLIIDLYRHRIVADFRGTRTLSGGCGSGRAARIQEGRGRVPSP
ncbi:MAG TPA: ATP-binding protein [Pseudonocardia sp.]|nr:ATP-binding protein [Pseudonocardia sp.]